MFLFAIVNCLLFTNLILADTIETQYFVIHHALDDNELHCFQEDIAQKLDAFVDHWHAFRQQTSFKEKLSIYIQPSVSFDASVALEKLAGKTIFADLDVIENSLEHDEETVKALVKEFSLKYPVFFKTKYFKKPTLRHAKQLVERMKELRKNEVPFRLLDNNAVYMHIKRYNDEAKNIVILGGSSDLSEREHPYLTLDTALHEIGHWFVHNVVDDKAGYYGAPISSIINELVADIVATTYLQNPCRARRKNGECLRDVSRHHSLLSEHLWQDGDSHTRNAPLAHFLWDFYQKDKEGFADNFVHAFISAIENYPPFGREYTREQLAIDDFLETSLDYMNDFTVSTVIADSLCAAHHDVHESVCTSRTEKYFGDAGEGFAYAQAMLDNAPLTIGSNARVLDENGQKRTIWFSYVDDEERDLFAHIESNGETVRYQSRVFFQRDSRAHQIKFYPAPREGRKAFLWNVDGTVTYE